MAIFIIIEVILVAIFTVPKLFKINPYVITSGSMEPKYPVGSLVYVKSMQPQDINTGDGITFYMENSNIIATHQVYKIDQENKLFYTQGINNKNENGEILHDATPVKYTSLIGKVILCIPYLGYINKIITTSPGVYVVIAITITIITISIFLDYYKNKGEKLK